MGVVPWMATLTVSWPLRRLMASTASARRACLARSIRSNRLVWMAEAAVFKKWGIVDEFPMWCKPVAIGPDCFLEILRGLSLF